MVGKCTADVQVSPKEKRHRCRLDVTSLNTSIVGVSLVSLVFAVDYALRRCMVMVFSAQCA